MSARANRNAPPRSVGVALTLLACLVSGSAHSEAPGTPTFGGLFSYVGDFALGDAANRVDYQSLDAPAGVLYIAKMGAGQLVAFDTRTNTVIRALPGFPKITGVLAVPELHKVYASVPGAGIGPSVSVALGMLGLSSGHGAVAILSTPDLKEIARLPGGVFPDGIAYDPKERRTFVTDELGDGVTVIDADKDTLIARIDLGGEVGNVRYDPHTSMIYAPVQSRNELAVIDPAGAKLVAKHALKGADHPHGLIISPDAPIAYVACDGDDHLLTVDLATGNVLDHKPIAHDPDVLAIDPDTKRLYVAAESGTVSALNIASAITPVLVGNVFVGKDAHSVAVDPASHRLYFPLADVKGHAMLRVLAPAP